VGDRRLPPGDTSAPVNAQVAKPADDKPAEPPGPWQKFFYWWLVGLFIFCVIFGMFALCFMLSGRGGHRVDCASSCPNCNGGGGGGAAGLLIMFAIIGLLAIIYLSFKLLSEICSRHMEVSWMKKETQKHVVRDLSSAEERLTLQGQSLV
jgi:hypothetical protein